MQEPGSTVEGDREGTGGLKVAAGTHVELELVDDAGGVEALSLDLVPDADADLARGFLGLGTPLAQAILGHTAGSILPYRRGDMALVRIRSVSPGAGEPPAGAEARRQSVLRKAVARSEMINDLLFALGAGSKWGDYDPGRLPDNPDELAGKGEQGPRPDK